MKKKIIELLKEINPYEEFDENTKIIEEGIIDSMTLIMLIQELEETFSLTVPEDKITIENFESIYKIEKLFLQLKEN